MEYGFTICFIQKGDDVLLLNREKPAWMGCWNGIGGKIEPGETPHDCILREICEETGIQVDSIEFKGLVTWEDNGIECGGMYTYHAKVPEDYDYRVPLKTREGILDFKNIGWVMDTQNEGVAHNLAFFLPYVLGNRLPHLHACIFEDGKLKTVNTKKLDEIPEGV